MGINGRRSGNVILTQHEGNSSMFYDKVFGLNDLIRMYKWHLDNGFEKDREVLEGNGWFMLGWQRKYQ